MSWFLLFLGLALFGLGSVLPDASASLVCRILAVVVFVLGAVVTVLPLLR